MATSRLKLGAADLPDRYSDRAEVPVVYFLSTAPLNMPNDVLIKIGKTGNFQKRLSQHRASKHGIDFKVDVLCVVPADGENESVVLRYFKACRRGSDKETFTPEPSLVEYIRWLRDQHFVWIPNCEQCPRLEDIEPQDPSTWLPNPSRIKKACERPLFDDYGPLNLPPRELTPDDFYTNKIVIDAARNALGSIELDPASHAVANSVVRAKYFYTANDNGLARAWAGRVWLNPPFSKWPQWVPKIIAEWRRGDVEAMCVLCATRTLTAQYFKPIHDNANALCILNGRIPFWGGKAGDSPDDGHAVFYFGRDVMRFASAFSEIGSVTVNTGKVAICNESWTSSK